MRHPHHLEALTATVIQPVDQPVLMDGVSWDTYESLLADGGDHRRTRMTFDQGVLEIVTPSYEHEHVENIVTKVAEALMNARRQDYAQAGSTTFKSERFERGFGPDASYYVEHAAQVQGLTRIDLQTDPPAGPGDRNRRHTRDNGQIASLCCVRRSGSMAPPARQRADVSRGREHVRRDSGQYGDSRLVRGTFGGVCAGQPDDIAV